MEFIVDQILSPLMFGLTRGSIYALVALGFTVIYNTTDIINFAQGEFVMLGGMIAVSLYAILSGSPAFSADWAWAAMPLTVAGSVALVTVVGGLTRYAVTGRSWIHYGLIAGLAAMVLHEAFHLGPALSLVIAAALAAGMWGLMEKGVKLPREAPSTINMIIITIGASIFLKGLASLIWGKNPRPLPAFSGEDPLVFHGLRVAPQNLWVMGLMVLSVIFLYQFYKRTVTGKALRACAHDPATASLMGIDVAKMSLVTFAFSGLLGSMAGVVITPLVFTEYQIGTMLGLKGFCAAILGGIDSIPGAVIGGLAIGVLESMFGQHISSGYMDAFAFLVMLGMLFLRPQGLLGPKAVDRA